MASSLERTFRITPLYSFLPTIGILIPATVVGADHSGRDCVIGYGFLPLVFTLAISTFYFARQRWHKVTHKAPNHPLFWMTADFMIFAGYLTTLIFEWTRGLQRLGGYYGGSSPDVAMLEAYATVPLILNMMCHVFTFLINTKGAFRYLLSIAKSAPKTECPHCHHRIGGEHVDEVAQKGSGEGYSLLRGEDYDEDAARASSSEEGRIALPTDEEAGA